MQLLVSAACRYLCTSISLLSDYEFSRCEPNRLLGVATDLSALCRRVCGGMVHQHHSGAQCPSQPRVHNLATKIGRRSAAEQREAGMNGRLAAII